MKGGQDVYGFALSTLSYAFILFFINTVIENSNSATALQIWRVLLSVVVLLYFFIQTRSQTDYLLYENGLRLRNKIWRKDAFFAFDLLEEASPGRSAQRRRGGGMAYHDSLTLRFKDGKEIRFGVGDIEEFYVFRNALLQQIGYFEERDEEDDRY